MNEINKIYVASFLQGFGIVASVTYTLFFLSNGLSQTQIGILFSFFMISLALLEIPTGAFADTIGHKSSIALGTFLLSLSFLILAIGTSFNIFILAMLFASAGLAFQSGAISSFIHEILQKSNEIDQFEKVQGRMNSIFLLSGVIGAPLGAFLFEYYQRVPYFIAFLTTLLASFIVYIIKWEFHQKHEISFKTYFQKIHKGVLLTITNQRLLAFVLITITLTTMRLVFNQNISQPYLLSVGLSIGFIGILAAITSIILASIHAFTYKVSGKIGDTKSLILMIALPSLCAIVLGYLYTPLAILFLILLQVGHAYKEPVMAKLTQKELNDENRATMASTTSFFSSIAVGLLLPVWGNSIDSVGLHTTSIYIGLFTFAIGFFAILLYLRRINH